ncbi:putative gibberellin 20-oxidase [Paraphaeosphaeria sporulosa]|uniref:Putative gibberellin 20-oxidase n=1 Tax=Paraphaeosphaeria sporulosa TaxID=1460663 RepID=A0A177CTN3_9PLEO|nr:putative gibberellin 20-oxidase [Paraphaeosphaeria sporulosa]OAG10109.1 putative gibberellin 20-oxidase [Paraphaeosphaeria sporulosa]
MSTVFSSLPVVDIHNLKASTLDTADHQALSRKLYDALSTTGFAYIKNAPLSFGQDEIFELSRDFFALPLSQKMKLAKKSFRQSHTNTYRGYFPTQPHLTPDNLKEGFEIGNPAADHNKATPAKAQKINLSESNVWPDAQLFAKQERLEQIYNELQRLAANLLSLLAAPLGKDPNFFSSWIDDSLSTLRLLHYPPVAQTVSPGTKHAEQAVRLSCTPHTDSGILTLLHQDATGGLEVLNAAGEWIPAPYIPGSIVVNIGDLMARVSGSRFKATMHRVRAPLPNPDAADARFGRFSIPFFFEPGEVCSVSIEGEEDSIVYGDYLRRKMATFVEFQEDSGYDTGTTEE